MKQKFRYLRGVTAKRILAWCEKYPNDPLSKSYMGACGALPGEDDGDFSYTLSSLLNSLESRHPKNYFVMASAIYDATFQCRDTIGRIILKVIKKESHGKSKALSAGGNSQASGRDVRSDGEHPVGQG